LLSSLPCCNNRPFAKGGCKKHCSVDFHTATCTAHSGATKAHHWMVSVLGPLFRTAEHTVRTQHSVTASAGQRRGDVEIRNHLRDQASSVTLPPRRSKTRSVHHARPVARLVPKVVADLHVAAPLDWGWG